MEKLNTIPFILLVEDEQQLRYAVSFSLKRYGYSVEAAADHETGISAARKILARRDSIALLVSDIQMAGLDCFSFLKFFRDLAPSVPILILTGRDNGLVRRKIVAFSGIYLLEKPFDIGQLLAKVVSIIDQEKDCR